MGLRRRIVNIHVVLLLAALVEYASGQKICEKGGGGNGLAFPLLNSFGESDWPMMLRAVLYFFGLLWMFLGVGIISDVFMASIEVITSKEVVTQTKTGATVPVKVWNATVANLTLMALGSSAPEILLNVIEIVFNNYIAGDLGPSTIVGSAAFNLLVIMAVCVIAVVPVGTRKIDGLDVYGCTAFFSIFAYIWLVIILKFSSENVVELWEALVTFAFFPVLVLLAYLLDTGKVGIPGSTKPKTFVTQIGTSHFHPYEIEKYLQELEATHADLSDEKREEIMIEALQSKVKPSRAQYRMMATRNITGGKKVRIPKPIKAQKADIEMANISRSVPKSADKTVVNFKASAYSVLENAGKIVVTVVRSSGEDDLQVQYETEGVTANADEDYKETNGVLTFKQGELEKDIAIEIIDDDEPEEDEMFIVKLSNPSSNARIGSEGMTIVTIIDDDDPGIIGFKDEETHVTVQESQKMARIMISRFQGSKGTVTVDYETVNITAIGGDENENVDYQSSKGTLTFKPEEIRHELKIPVMDRHNYDKAETFKVVLSNVKGENDKAQLAQYNQCVVTIVHDGKTKSLIDNVSKVLNINADKYRVGTSSWGEQCRNVWTISDDAGVDGLAEGEEPEAPSTLEYFLHYVSVPFKLWFATCPPTDYCGGWACFCVALAYIGIVTVMISDLANLFGCVLKLDNEITAITFVALGTSLPDTFASKTAAINDENADASIGNVTGSNSVNVFLGLGMPWTLAALYWKFNGEDEEWNKRYGRSDDDKDDGYKEDSEYFKLDIYKQYGEFPGFVVPAGALAFSVIVFVLCALSALGTLSLRRSFLGAELGGDPFWAKVTAAFFFFLWMTYVVVSSLQVKGHIGTGPL